ncbi:hypothetical protein J6590_037170 [Homalodisca vitripennis]|nr:hypothetical protein J6590_037170 [Homalodisca vitripennis]
MKKCNARGSAARDPHGIKQITVGPPHGIKQITMFIRENVECLDSSFTTTTTIKNYSCWWKWLNCTQSQCTNPIIISSCPVREDIHNLDLFRSTVQYKSLETALRAAESADGLKCLSLTTLYSLFF